MSNKRKQPTTSDNKVIEELKKEIAELAAEWVKKNGVTYNSENVRRLRDFRRKRKYLERVDILIQLHQHGLISKETLEREMGL